MSDIQTHEKRGMSVYQLSVMKMGQSVANLQNRCKLEAYLLHTPRYTRLQVLMITNSAEIF
jgi:hypothetical protein